jgi:hypothetical protein
MLRFQRAAVLGCVESGVQVWFAWLGNVTSDRYNLTRLAADTV